MAHLMPETRAAESVMEPVLLKPWATFPVWGDLGAGLCVAGLLIPKAVADGFRLGGLAVRRVVAQHGVEPRHPPFP